MEAAAALFASGTAATAAAAAPAALGSTFAFTGPALTISSGLGAGVGAATTGALTAATTAGLGGSLATFGIADMLSGAFDNISLIGDVLGTFSELTQKDQFASDRELQALQIGNQAILDEVAALEALRANISAQVVNSYASGLAPTGSVQSGIEEAVEQQEFETRVGGRDARIREAQMRMEGDAAGRSTTAILFSGLSGAYNRYDAIDSRKERRG